MQLSHEMGVVPNPKSSYTQTKYGLLNDMMRILYGNTSVSAELAQAFRELGVGIGPGRLCDAAKHLYCVDIKTLSSVISTTRENRVIGRFRKMYPASDGERYSRLIKHMHGVAGRKLERGRNSRTLWQIHHLLTALEKIY